MGHDEAEDRGLAGGETLFSGDDVRADGDLASGLGLGKLGFQAIDEVGQPASEVHFLLPDALERPIEGSAVAVVVLAQSAETLEVVARPVEAKSGEQA